MKLSICNRTEVVYKTSIYTENLNLLPTIEKLLLLLEDIVIFTAAVSVEVSYICFSVQHTVVPDGYISTWIRAQLVTMKRPRVQTWNRGVGGERASHSENVSNRTRRQQFPIASKLSNPHKSSSLDDLY
jgi:hypothetical protein